MSISESPLTSGRRAAIAASIYGLGDKFKPELRAAGLAHIRKSYPDGLVAEPDIMGDGTLEIDDWVPDALGLYARDYPVVDEPIGKFSALNTHPNAYSDVWNNTYNRK